jgi:hypothetical protein
MFTTKRANCCKLIDVFDVPPLRARLRQAVSAFAIAVALGFGPASIARADAPSAEAAVEAPRALAKAKFEEGVKAFGEHRYTDAVAAFLRADAIDPSAALSFNVARAFEHLDNPSSALRWYRDYLRRQPGAANAVEVQARVAALSAMLAGRGVQQLTVISTPVGASVLIDKRAAGAAPITTELAPGAHHVRLERAGYLARDVDLVLDAHVPQDLVLELQALPAASPSRAAAPPHRDTPAYAYRLERPFGSAPWIVLGGGGVSLLGALGFELSRRSAESAAKDATQRDYPAHFEAMQSRQTTARVLAGVGGALLVTGGVLVLLNTPRRPTARLAASCGAAGCWLAASGSFQ